LSSHLVSVAVWAREWGTSRRDLSLLPHPRYMVFSEQVLYELALYGPTIYPRSNLV
jgi:hypothetical protein